MAMKFRLGLSVLLLVTLASFLLSGCFSAGDDFYSYVTLSGSLKLDSPDDMITVEVDARGTLLANEQDHEHYEISIGAVEHCKILWTVGDKVLQSAEVFKKWDGSNHLTGLKIEVKDERTGNTKTVYSKTPDSREWIIDLDASED